MKKALKKISNLILVGFVFCLFSSYSFADQSPWHFKIGTFNTWFFPFKDSKSIRVSEIASVLQKSDYDVILLQEAWLGWDRAKLQEGSQFPYANYFFTPTTLGSGVMTLSRHPIESRDFSRFRVVGGIWGWADGDFWSGKGVSHELIKINGKNVSVFNTHTISSRSMVAPKVEEYGLVRAIQLFDVFRMIVEQRKSDLFVLGGDFNTTYDTEEFKIFQMLTSLPGIIPQKTDPSFCTYCADNIFVPEPLGQIDYIFSSPKLKVENFDLSFNNKFITPKGRAINFSDHYGLQAVFSENLGLSEITSGEARLQTKLGLKTISDLVSKWFTDFDDKIEDSKLYPIFDAFFLRHNLKARMRLVRAYMLAIEPPKPNEPEYIGLLRVKLDSYFNLFSK